MIPLEGEKVMVNIFKRSWPAKIDGEQQDGGNTGRENVPQNGLVNFRLKT